MVTILQIICVLLVTFGITIEFIYSADLGFLAITIGSMLFAISTKIQKRKLKKQITLNKTWKEN